MVLDFYFSDDDVDDGEDDKDFTTVGFTTAEKRSFLRDWSNALIIKLLSHTVGYNFLVRRLNELWKICSRMDVIDVGNDTYVVQITNIEEVHQALYEGPSITANHYLMVRQCYHDLDLDKFSISNLSVWIRFPNYQWSITMRISLLKIVRLFGNPLKVDNTPMSAKMGQFS